MTTTPSVELKSLAFGSIGAGYTLVESQVTFPCSFIIVQNLTDSSLMFSFDGVHDHFPLPLYSFFTIDVAWNRGIKPMLSIDNLKLYVKQINVPTTGSVYVTGYK